MSSCSATVRQRCVGVALHEAIAERGDTPSWATLHAYTTHRMGSRQGLLPPAE